MDYVEGRILWDPTLPGVRRPRQRAAHLRRDEPRDRGAALGRSRRRRPRRLRQARATTSRARSTAGPSSTGRPRPSTIEAMDRLIEWLPANIPPRRRDPIVHGDYRLDNMIFHPDRAAHARGARLGALDARPSARRLRLPLHDVAHRAGAHVPRPRRARPRGARHPDRARIRRDVLRAHRPRSRSTHSTGISTSPTTCSASRRSCRASTARARGRATARARRRARVGRKARAASRKMGWRQVERMLRHEDLIRGDARMDFEYSPRTQDLQATVCCASWTSTCIPTEARYHDEVEATAQRRSRGSRRGDRGAEGEGARGRACGTCSCRESERGAGLTNLEYAPLCEIMGRVALVAGGVQLLRARHRQHGDARALRHARAARSSGCEPLLDGKIRSCFAMTEPAVASSDATNIEARIERDGDDYVINGRKWWTSGAADPRCKISSSWARPTPTTPTATSSSR